MKSIRIEGLRSLKDTGFIPLKPLTILLGENSSGKSTFLRTFPLLRQSLESNTRGPILWYGSFVDFGKFDSALSKFSEDKTISFSFILEGKKLPNIFGRHRSAEHTFDNGDVEIRMSLVSDSRDKNTRVKSFDIKYEGNLASVIFEKTGKIEKFTSNNIDITEYFSNVTSSHRGLMARSNLIPSFTFPQKENRYLDPRLSFDNPQLKQKVAELLSPFLHGRTNKESFSEKFLQNKIVNVSSFLEQTKTFSNTNTWVKKTNLLKVDDKTLTKLHSLIYAKRIPWLVTLLNIGLDAEFNNVKYIAPLRATAERYYRSQDLSVNEVDYQGKNLAMFIKNLNDRERSSYTEWLHRNFKFNLLCNTEGGHLSLSLKYSDSSSEHNITDMGFGFSQILPIITQLWYSSYGPKNVSRHNRSATTYMVIEQPELHLHPRFQAKMVDAFVKAIKLSKKLESDINLIIETHSETIINQIGHLIAKSELDKEDVSITIFDKQSPDTPTSVSASKFDNEGLLIDWPWGFFEPELSNK